MLTLCDDSQESLEVSQRFCEMLICLINLFIIVWICWGFIAKCLI